MTGASTATVETPTAEVRVLGRDYVDALRYRSLIDSEWDREDVRKASDKLAALRGWERG